MTPSEGSHSAASKSKVKPVTKEASEITPLLSDKKNGNATQQPASASISVNISSTKNADAEEEKEEKNIDWGRILRFMLPYAVPYSFRLRLLAASSLALTLVLRVLNLVPAYAIKLAVDSVASKEPKPPLAAIGLYFGVGMLCTAIGSVEDLASQFLHSEVRQNFAVDAFRHLHHLDMSYHLKQKSGKVSSIIWRGSYGIEQLMDVLLFTAIPTLFEAAVVVVIFFHLGTPLISIIILLSVFVYWWISKASTDARVKQSRKTNKLTDECSSKVVDTLMNVETVKVFGMENFEVESYDALRTEVRNMKNNFAFVRQSFNFAKTLVQSGAGSGALALAAVAASNGRLSAGDFVLINTYIKQLFRPLLSLSRLYDSILYSATSVEDVIKVFDIEPLITDRDNAVNTVITQDELESRTKGEISFDNVSFSYKTDDRKGNGISNISFKVPPGRMLGVVGSSGAGKSTLIKLATRLFDPDEGAVKIDGVDIREFTTSSLRKLFGVVSQDTSLFNSSIRYNVSYGKQDSNDTEIWSVIKAAALNNFCESLNDKLDTIVGERGVRLSGGEKQRVGVARCLIRAPAFVILDEASSALDSQTEREMQANIRELIRGRTTIAVAHRLSTIMMADEIIVLGNSTIVESGTHKELIAKRGKYYQMWKTQTNVDLFDGQETVISEED